MSHSTIARTVARGIRLFVVAALLGAMVMIAAPPPVAQASTFVVDTSADNLPALTACTADPGDCSLRGAITRANTDLGPDTITFAVTTNGAPIVLTWVANEDGNASGDLDILGGGGDLTIQGNGAAKTIIDGDEIDRVFHVCPDGGCTNTVIFNGVTIQNGKLVSSGGGGILNVGSTTMVHGSTVSANTAYGGGGIYNAGGTTTVDGSTVSANTADDDGGGIFNLVTLNVRNGSTIGGAGTGNTAQNGGGIFNYYGTTAVDGSTVSANTADEGGGIYIWAGSTTVTGSCILNNWATSNGGGLYNDENTLGATNVTGSSIVGNSATSFFNNQDAEQTATGNWWGAATGPNTPGADTVEGKVDTSDHLTEPVRCTDPVYLALVQKHRL